MRPAYSPPSRHRPALPPSNVAGGLRAEGFRSLGDTNQKEITMAQFETRKATKAGRDQTIARRKARALKRGRPVSITALAVSIVAQREGGRWPR